MRASSSARRTILSAVCAACGRGSALQYGGIPKRRRHALRRGATGQIMRGSRHRCGQGESQKAILSRALPGSRSPRTLRAGR
jgi:hypothetical protein